MGRRIAAAGCSNRMAGRVREGIYDVMMVLGMVLAGKIHSQILILYVPVVVVSTALL